MTQKLIELTRSVAPHASVNSVRMSLGEFRAPNIESEKSLIEFSISPSYERLENSAYLSSVCYRIRAVADDDDKTETGFKIHAHFDAVIEIDGDQEPDSIDAFLKLNTVFVTWSYLREFVQNSTSRLQMPPLTLPLMTASAIASYIGEQEECDQ
jgi:preprotein translocase subunit SecB